MADCVTSGTSPYVTCTGENQEYETPDITKTDLTSGSHTGIQLNTAVADPGPPVVREEEASLENEANITIEHKNTVTPTTSGNLIGINTSLAGEYEIENSGDITITSRGRGQAYGIAGNGAVEGLAIENTGTITVNRILADSDVKQITSATININDDGNNATTGNNITNVSALSIAAGIFAEEELEELSVDNESTGVIQADGRFAVAVYSRAGNFELENEGAIKHLDGAGEGIAIGVVADGGNLSKFTFENEGSVEGDMVMVGAHAQRWWLLANGFGTGTVSTGNVIGDVNRDNVLNINSQFGQLDTEIENEGTITGNMYYGNGAHVLSNEDEGKITGNIIVDQRALTITGRTCTIGGVDDELGKPNCWTSATTVGQSIQGNGGADGSTPNSASQVTVAAASGTTTFTLAIWGAKDFTFDNAGEMEGDLTVATAPATTIFGFSVPDSTVLIKPHIFGGGNDDEDDAVNPEAQAYIDGTLKIADGIVNGTGGTSSIERTTTIDPVIESLVRTGEWYTVSTGLFGNDVPDVDGTVLVSWEAEKNALGALVIGSTVADASTVEGLSRPGISTLNALMNTESDDEDLLALGGAVQNLKDEDDVRKAGEQLAPETNFATQEAAKTLAFLTGQYIDNRLTNVGAKASGGGYGAPSGLGMKEPRSEPARAHEPRRSR